MKPFTRETIVDRRQPQMRWSAVFAGAAVSVGLWILLQTLGMGIGLSSINTNDAGSLRGVGIGTGIWSLIAPLIAMFLGAMIAGRLAGTFERRTGGLHGAVVWALTSVLGLMAVLSVIGAIASGAVKVGGAAVNVAGNVASSAAGAAGAAGGNAQQAMSALGIDTNDLLAPVNQKLQEEGKPAVTSDQLTATIRGVAQHGLREGKVDRQVLVQELAKNTSLSQADAQDIADRFGERYEQVVNKISQGASQAAQQAKQVALQAAQATGKALLGTGIMLLLGLIASVIGGMLGVRRDGSVEDRRRTVPETVAGGPEVLTTPP